MHRNGHEISMKHRIPDALVHFFGFHMFYYAIGFCAHLWFMAHFSTEISGNPLRLSMQYALPVAFLIYLPIIVYVYRRSTGKPSTPARIAKYGISLLVYSMLTGITTAGYVGLLSVTGKPLETDLASPVTDAFRPGSGMIYQTNSGKRFKTETDNADKTLMVFKSRFGYYYWVDKKI